MKVLTGFLQVLNSLDRVERYLLLLETGLALAPPNAKILFLESLEACVVIGSLTELDLTMAFS